MERPCLNCTERILGCHSKCSKYLSFKDKLDEIRSKKYEESLKTKMTTNLQRTLVSKCKKKGSY